jgi:hypothetical protein
LETRDSILVYPLQDRVPHVSEIAGVEAVIAESREQLAIIPKTFQSRGAVRTLGKMASNAGRFSDVQFAAREQSDLFFFDMPVHSDSPMKRSQ